MATRFEECLCAAVFMLCVGSKGAGARHEVTAASGPLVPEAANANLTLLARRRRAYSKDSQELWLEKKVNKNAPPIAPGRRLCDPRAEPGNSFKNAEPAAESGKNTHLTWGKLGPKKEDCAVYVTMPKAGSTTVKYTLKANRRQKEGGPEFENADHLPMTVLQHCYWFTFVRNPVARLVSGFFEGIDDHIKHWSENEIGCKGACVTAEFAPLLL